MQINSYRVEDSLGHTMRIFNSYIQASEYKQTYGNISWRIIRLNKDLRI